MTDSKLKGTASVPHGTLGRFEYSALLQRKRWGVLSI
jgi:hypothetical protein